MQWVDVKKFDLFKRHWVAENENRLIITVSILEQILSYCGSTVTTITFSSQGGQECQIARFQENKNVLSIIAKLCPSLHSIDISRIEATEDGLLSLSKHCSNIKDLSIGHYHSPWDSADEDDALSDLFSKCQRLQSLQLHGTMISGKCLLYLPFHSIQDIRLRDMIELRSSHIQVRADLYYIHNLAIHRIEGLK